MAAQPNKKKADVTELVNPINSGSTGRIAPIIAALIIGSIAWMFVDPELRRGLSSFTGIGYVEEVVDQLVNKEYTIKLHGTWTSTCSQRVMLVAKEKELDIDLQVVNMTELKTPLWLEKQAFGQIPVLEIEDEGIYLTESRAIAQHLERRYPKRGTSFAVNGLLPNAFYDQALSIEMSQYDATISKIFYEAVMKPRRGGIPDPVVVTSAKAAWAAKLDGYESILSKRPYLAGNNVTLADLFHLPYGQKIIDAGHGEPLMDKHLRPHVAKWWHALSERPSWKAVLKDVEQWQEAQRKAAEAEELAREAEEAKHHK